MEESFWTSEKIFSSCELVKITQKFNQIFSIFKKNFSYDLKALWVNGNDTIVNIQRWLISDSNQIYWDYLWTTHSTMLDLPIIPKWIDSKNSYHCIKLILSSWRSIVFSINPVPDSLSKNILCLDKYFLWLNEYERKEFDRLYLGINKIESDYFHSIWYTESLNWIKKMSKDELLKTLNMEISR